MKRIILFLTNMLFFFTLCFGQQDQEKVKKLKFCGYKYTDTALLRNQFGQQIAFLQINSGDTIVDVGSSSGAYIGAINVIAEFKHAHFILVDIDSNCLNSTKVSNMIAHYETLRGSAFNNSIGFVVNTTDSLHLPSNSKKKLWVFNTLHEIPDKPHFIKQISLVMQTGGEVIIAELLPVEKKKIHKGCNKPLTSEDEINKLMMDAGFTFINKVINPTAVKKMKNPYCLFRFVKQ